MVSSHARRTPLRFFAFINIMILELQENELIYLIELLASQNDKIINKMNKNKIKESPNDLINCQSIFGKLIPLYVPSVNDLTDLPF